MFWRSESGFRKQGGAVSGIFGGGDAAGDAADATLEGTLAGVKEQKRQFNLTRDDFKPFREAGTSALQQQMAFLGLGGGGSFAGSGGGGQTINPEFTAFQDQRRSLQYQIDNAKNVTNFPGGIISNPFLNMRRKAVGLGPVQSTSDLRKQLANLGDAPEQFLGSTFTGGGGDPTGFDSAFRSFIESPGQVFLRQQQEKTLLRNAGATGNLGGGNVRTALQEQAFNLGATQLGTFQNRLAALSGQGQTAVASGAQFGQQSANQISNLLQAGGNAQASGILGAQQANAGLASGLISAGIGIFSDKRLKGNIIKIGELFSGLNVYIWTWNKEGRRVVKNQSTTGVIAQEVAKLFPDAVTESGGYLQVNYGGIS